MPRTYLSKLIDVGRLMPFPQPGVWQGDAGAATFLSNLVHDIDVGGAVRDPRIAHSVPSVYARPILFAQSLADEASPLHDAVVAEWRGLMAVVALQPWIGYRLHLVDYPVPPPVAGMGSAVGRVPHDDMHLRTMLYSLLPQPPQFWNPLRMLYVEGALVGAASPWTMVFTPASKIRAGILPWADGDVLQDPIAHYGSAGRSLELTILYHWVGHLIAAGNNPLMPNWGLDAVGGNFLAGIGQQLAQWRAQLVQYVDPAWGVPGLTAPKAEAGPYQYALLGAQPPMWNAAPGAAATAAPPQSDLFMAATRAGAGNVVALRRKGLAPRTRVHDGCFVEDLYLDTEHLPASSGNSLETKGGVVHGVDWLMVEEVFFSPSITRLNLAKDALVCGPGAAAEYSIPLTTAFFKYFAHSDIAGILDVAVTGVGNEAVLTAAIKLPLKGGRTLTLQKQYSLARDVADAGATTPAFGLWPNFVADDWTHNFASFVGPSKLGDVAFTVKPLVADGTAASQTKVDGSEKELRIWRCVKPPIGFALSSNGAEAGLILRKFMPRPEDRVGGKKWVVSVDFGTANTMISCQIDGSDRSNVLRLQPRLVLLNTGADVNVRTISNGLYPIEGATPPFRTLLYRLDATAFGLATAAYSLRFEFVGSDVAHLVHDLKWGRDPAPMRAYLDGLVRYIVCEARAAGVSDLAVKWSYPLALPAPSHTAMAQFWAAVAGNYSVPTLTMRIGHPKTAGSNELEESVSESEATCRALARFNGSPVPVKAGGLCIAVDVGGGSTDFAYWSNGNLLDQFSFKLAGNDVLCGEWKNFPGFLEAIIWAATGAMPPRDQMEPLFKMEGNQVEVLINDILSQAVDNTGVRFTDSDPLGHPVVGRIFQGGHTASPWYQVRTLALLLFGGVSYYAGLHARDFTRHTTIKDHITLCFGGRGANLMTWLSNTPAVLKAALVNAFIQGYTNGVGFGGETRPSPLVNVVGPPLGGATAFPRLKEEVAMGILNSPIGEMRSPGDPYVGEVGWSTPGVSDAVEWRRRLSVEEMAKLIPPTDAGNCYLSHLLNNVLHKSNPAVLKLNVDLPGIDPVALGIDWASIQNRMKNDILVTGVSQPLFAIELKAVMALYVSQAVRGLTGAAVR